MEVQEIHLPLPPIIEVVCGVVFEPISDLDPLALGIYWDQRSDEYPNRSLQMAIGEPFSDVINLLPVRAFLVGRDDQFVL
jgi:hypothetical protein